MTDQAQAWQVVVDLILPLVEVDRYNGENLTLQAYQLLLPAVCFCLFMMHKKPASPQTLVKNRIMGRLAVKDLNSLLETAEWPSSPYTLAIYKF